MKTISVICITTLLFCLIFTSCSTPVVAPTPLPTATISPTPVVTPQSPFTQVQAEQMLETLIGRDVTYNDDIYRPSIYQFDYENTIFRVNKFNGDIATYAKLIVDNKPTNELIDKHQALQIAIQKSYEINPSFFDYDIDYRVEHYNDDTTSRVYLTQISRLGRKTGNSALVWVKINGAIRTISIWDSEDPTMVDKDSVISKEEALEIAYEVSIDKLKKKVAGNPDIEIEFDDRSNHDVEIDFAVRKSIPYWYISIKFPSNVLFTLGYITTIDGNTGKVTMCSGYK